MCVIHCGTGESYIFSQNYMKFNIYNETHYLKPPPLGRDWELGVRKFFFSKLHEVSRFARKPTLYLLLSCGAWGSGTQINVLKWHEISSFAKEPTLLCPSLPSGGDISGG